MRNRVKRGITTRTLAALCLGLAACGTEQPESAVETDGANPVPSLDMSRVQRVGEGTVRALATNDIWYFQVYGVYSSNYAATHNNQWEYTEGLSTTVGDHGGAVLQVATLELGYSGYFQATYNYSLVNQVQTQAVWDANGNYAGLLRYFDVSGSQGGYFHAQVTSAFNNLSYYDNLQIQ
jgi:hypothetical protein